MSLVLLNEEPLFVRIGNQRAPLVSLKHASDGYKAFTSHYDLGGRDSPPCTIETEDGVCVGRISYNGRVWDKPEWSDGDKPIYCPIAVWEAERAAA